MLSLNSPRFILPFVYSLPCRDPGSEWKLYPPFPVMVIALGSKGSQRHSWSLILLLPFYLRDRTLEASLSTAFLSPPSPASKLTEGSR